MTYAEYRARCGCCQTFRSSPPGVDPRCWYDNKVRDAVLDRLIEDSMSIPKILAAMQRDFLLDLSQGFVYDCIGRRVAELDGADYRRWTLEKFSGTLCIDELHLGRYTLLLATDPIGDFPVAFALVESNDAEHMRRFLANLKRHGFEPKVVVTDGSPLYPKLLAELWPQAEHQLCVFHVLQDINGHVLDAVKRLRRALKRRGQRGRKRGRGRPKKSARKRRGLTLEDKANFVFKHRHLIVTKEENLSDQQRADLRTMCQYLPELQTLRNFVIKVGRLFDAGPRGCPVVPPSSLPPREAAEPRDVHDDPRIGEGDEDVGWRQVREDDRLPPHVARVPHRYIAASSPAGDSSARDSHEQSCRTHQPQAAVLREVPLQMASPPQYRPLPVAGFHPLATNPSDHNRLPPTQSSGRLKLETAVGLSEKCRF